ncbi:MAG: hypothetical protein H8D47_00565 [Planctomycetes bacterium]|nr:hypothetical protein [Planctomycetota bacterium]MBL7106306.1 hypothetical protein [Phycisphaerae bacterium]
MKRRDFLKMSAAIAAGVQIMENSVSADSVKKTPKKLNPKTKWLRDAKWGAFTHYLVHMPSAEVPEDMTPAKWNKKVDSFDAEALADKFASVGVPYFFITIGQAGGYYCSPNETYEKLIGKNSGKLSDRDLVADCAAAMKAKGIRQCAYLPGVGRHDASTQKSWQDAITEWSQRWGDSISAWWIDGKYSSEQEFKLFTKAFKAGNPDTLISYNTGPVGMNRDQLMPATEYEDYLAGECDYFLPTCGVRVFDGKEYYLGPDISGDQLHFLNFLGEWWGTGKTRFSNELVTAWTKHININGGTVTWDLPLSDSGQIDDSYLGQLAAINEMVKNG